MSMLPAAGYLTSAARTEGEVKAALDDLVASIKQIPGAGVAETTLTIASGAVTPPGGGPGVFSIDTEAAAASDDLTNLIQTNIPDGSLLLIRCANAARVVTVKTSAGGAGQIVLAAGLDVMLNDPKKWVCLKRTGTLWEEVSSPTLLAPTLSAGLVVADPTAALGIASKQYIDQRIAPRGELWGCTMSNGTDAVNDINIAAGEAASDDLLIANRVVMVVPAMTKELDVAWSVGSIAGGRDTGAIADGTWHVFVIQRPDTGMVDALYSLSATAPTMPPNYTKKRRIGSILRESGSIVAFTQDGDYFRRNAAVLDVNVTNPGASAVLRTLSVPAGLTVMALLDIRMEEGSGGGLILLSDPASTDVAPSATVAPLSTISIGIGGAASHVLGAQAMIRTNTSAQIRHRHGGTDASTIFRIATLGWIDTRGRVN